MLAFHSVNVIRSSQSQIKIIESIKVMTALPVMESSQSVNPAAGTEKNINSITHKFFAFLLLGFLIPFLVNIRLESLGSQFRIV